MIARARRSLFYFAGMVSQLILKLIDDMGGGLSESTIRGRLTNIHEEAQALEEQFKRVTTEIGHSKTRIRELEAELQQQEPSIPPDRLEETAERMLVLYFNSQRITLEQVAHRLAIKPGVAQYHADNLAAAEMLQLGFITPAGAMYVLTPKGRAYVVENNLA